MEPLPEGKCYHCKGCGGRTRFTVVRTLRVEEFHHQNLAGDLIGIDESNILDEEVERVTCRKCLDGGPVEIIDKVP